MTSLEIGLLSATVGGACGIFSQVISKILQDNADNKKIIRNIISEERRLAYLIRQNSYSLYANDFNCTYFKFQLEIVEESYIEKASDMLREALANHDKIFDKHADLIGEYLKNINEFCLLSNCSKKLEQLLEKIISEKYLDRVEFLKKNSILELEKEYNSKFSLLSEKSIEYAKMFDEVGLIILKIAKDFEVEND